MEELEPAANLVTLNWFSRLLIVGKDLPLGFCYYRLLCTIVVLFLKGLFSFRSNVNKMLRIYNLMFIYKYRISCKSILCSVFYIIFLAFFNLMSFKFYRIGIPFKELERLTPFCAKIIILLSFPMRSPIAITTWT